MTKHLIKRIKTSTCALYGTAGLADTFLSFGIATLLMPIYNIGMGIDAKLLGLAMIIPRVLDAITDPLMGNISDNTRSRFGRRRQYIFAGVIMCALLFPFIWMPPAGSQGVVLGYLVGAMCLHSIFYTIFAVPYSALSYEITSDYDERTRLLAWRLYFSTVAGVTIQWLYKLCLMAGDTDAEVKSYLVDRYGEFVLLKPVFSAANAALWLAGPLIFLLGLLISLRYIRARHPQAPSPLTAEEQAQLDKILKD